MRKSFITFATAGACVVLAVHLFIAPRWVAHDLANLSEGEAAYSIVDCNGTVEKVYEDHVDFRTVDGKLLRVRKETVVEE